MPSGFRPWERAHEVAATATTARDAAAAAGLTPSSPGFWDFMRQYGLREQDSTWDQVKRPLGLAAAFAVPTLAPAVLGGGAAAGAAGAAGGGASALGTLGKIGGAVKDAAPYVLGGLGAIRGVQQQGKADDLQNEALDMARQQYADRAPFREALKERALAPLNAAPNFAAQFADPGNPYSKISAGQGAPAGGQLSLPPGMSLEDLLRRKVA